MKDCVLCKTRYQKGSGVTFHKFPNDKKILELWLKNIEKLSWLPKKYDYICSNHFSDDCFIKHNSCTTLKKCSIPKIFCSSAGMHTVLHGFPNLEKDRNRFNTWLYAIGGNIVGLENERIFKYRRVCHSHFEEKYRCRYDKISNIAVPTLNMPGPLHSFPSSVYPHEERYNKWKSVLSGKLKCRGDSYIHGNVRLCGRHFEQTYKTSGNRLTTLYLSSATEGEGPVLLQPIFPTELTSSSYVTKKNDKEQHRATESRPAEPVSNVRNNSSSNALRDQDEQTTPNVSGNNKSQNQKGLQLFEQCNSAESENKTYLKAEVGKLYKVEYVNKKIRLVDYCPVSDNDVSKDPMEDPLLDDSVNDVTRDDDIPQHEIDQNDSSCATEPDVTEQRRSVPTTLEPRAIQAESYQQKKILKSVALADHSYHVNYSLRLPPREKENESLMKEDFISKENKLYKIVCTGGKITMVEHGTVGNVDGGNLNNDTSLDKNVTYKCIMEENSKPTHSREDVLHQSQPRDALKPVVNPNISSTKPNKSTNHDLFNFNTKVFTADKNRIFITNEHLAALQRGEDMVMIPMSNYTAIRNKLEQLEFKLLRYQKDLKHFKNLAFESAQLRRLKEQLSKKFTKAQIDTILHSKNCGWPDKEMERAAFIRQNINQKMYFYLKHHMGFPLPQTEVLRQWMIKKKLVVPRKKKKADAPQDDTVNNNIQVVDENVQVQQSEVVTEELQLCDDVQTEHLQTVQIQSADPETAEAIGSITQFDQNQHYYIQNGSEKNTLMETIDGMSNYVWEHDITPNEVIIPQSDTTKIRKKHVDVNLRCQLCIKYFETEVQVRQHVPLHYYNTHYTNYLDAQPPYQCEFCGENVRTRPLLILHHRAHLGITNFRCWHPGCSFVSNRVKTLTRHSRQHSNSNLQCEFCPARFPYRQLLNLHRNRVHSARVKRRCRLCFAVTLNDYTFRRHMRAHTRPPKLKCTEPGCMEAFYSSVERRRHRMTHLGDELPFKCPHCPHAAYTKIAMLTRHMRRHETDKINHCLKCDQMFYDYGEYFEHCVTQHGGTRVTLKCACSLSFQSKKGFETHQLQCDFVEKTNVDNNTNELQGEGSINIPPSQEHSQDSKPRKKRKKKHTTDGDDHSESKKLRKDTEEITSAVDNNVGSVQIIENILVSEVNNQHVEHDAGGEDATLSMPVIIDGTVPSDVITMTLEEYQQYLLSTQENCEEYGSLNIDTSNVIRQYGRQRH